MGDEEMMEGSQSPPPVMTSDYEMELDVELMVGSQDQPGEKLQSQPWIDAVRGNRIHDRVFSVEYITPKIVDGEIDVHEVQSGLTY